MEELYVNSNTAAHLYRGFENGFYVYQRTYQENVGYGGVLNSQDTYKVRQDYKLVIRENVNWDDNQDIWTNNKKEIIVFE